MTEKQEAELLRAKGFELSLYLQGGSPSVLPENFPNDDDLDRAAVKLAEYTDIAGDKGKSSS